MSEYAKKENTKVLEFTKSNQTPYSCILFINSIQQARYSNSLVTKREII
jgi:hypothetical protein